MWVFGYGSLIWKADFPFKQKQTGYIKGFIRRFYQQSVDHRGRPSLPGRVVTLIPATEEDEVWGVAYEIYPDDEEVVTQHLDYREKCGYQKELVTFYPHEITTDDTDGHRKSSMIPSKTTSPFQLTIYIGCEDNEWFAGPATIEDIAKQIVVCEGPSGTNREYLYNLADAMRTLAPGVEDDHLFTLEAEVKKIEKEGGVPQVKQESEEVKESQKGDEEVKESQKGDEEVKESEQGAEVGKDAIEGEEKSNSHQEIVWEYKPPEQKEEEAKSPEEPKPEAE